MMHFIKKILPISLKWKLLQIALKGDQVHCPVCKSDFITFLPYGSTAAGFRANAFCPKCFSLERTRAMWLVLQQKGWLDRPHLRLLHVAPEKSLFHHFANTKNIEYHPIDKFEPRYHYPKGTRDMDVLHLTYPDNHFDVIICSHVLEHIPDDLGAMRELYRVLKPGGTALLPVPMDLNRTETFEDHTITDQQERERIFGQYDHVRIYGKDYSMRLQQAGFRLINEDFIADLSLNNCFRFGLGVGEIIPIAGK